jgi:propionyl-CoA carboxylase alpha chain
MFGKILIANRGEIALRILRTCRRLGVRTVAVYSEADARSLHVQAADEAVLIGPPQATRSYLDFEKVLAAARQTGAEAIHPGYGFLSENPRFAQAVLDAGLAWIGPPPRAIALLGDKMEARKLAMQGGIPVIPGLHEPVEDPLELREAARRIGYPLLVKPAAGGGGKGMRIVREDAELEGALAASRQEARKAFADDRVFLERYVEAPRHVEIQVLVDHHGHAIHLGERECSIQRRYQKVLEEAPSVAVGEVQRRRMGRMARDLALEAGYTNAGTVEFIFDGNGDFYFLEMNSRLQVEHPVTEAVTGLDLVELQLRIAAGEPLPLTQDDVLPRGWAVEARICAEDPTREFLPSTGMITRYAEPRGPGVRVDSAVAAGSAISVYYDSLIAKVIASGETRPQAIERLVQALNGFHVEGVTTNLDFVNGLLCHPLFLRGDFSTRFIEEHTEKGRLRTRPNPEHLALMALAATLVFHLRSDITRKSLECMRSTVGPGHPAPASTAYVVKGDEDAFEIDLTHDTAQENWAATVNGVQHAVALSEFELYQRRLLLHIDGQEQRFRLEYRGSFIWLAYRGITRVFEVYTPREWRLSGFMPGPTPPLQEDLLRCPMPGLVVHVRVQPGDRVYRGQDLVVLESMKMEAAVPSPIDGVVADVLVKAGDAVETDQVLVRFG